MDHKALQNIPYGLFLLTAAENGRDNGCIANTCFQVAGKPLLLCISVQMGNLTREMIEASGEFNVSVLTEDVPFSTILRFGMRRGRDLDKFAGFPSVARSQNGLYYLTDTANTMFSCKVVKKTDLGSHMLFIGEVTEARVLSQAPSCTYAHYHKAIRPKV